VVNIEVQRHQNRCETDPIDIVDNIQQCSGCSTCTHFINEKKDSFLYYSIQPSILQFNILHHNSNFQYRIIPHRCPDLNYTYMAEDMSGYFSRHKTGAKDVGDARAGMKENECGAPGMSIF